MNGGAYQKTVAKSVEGSARPDSTHLCSMVGDEGPTGYKRDPLDLRRRLVRFAVPLALPGNDCACGRSKPLRAIRGCPGLLN